MINYMINILKRLLDFIYDKNCYFCHKSVENSLFCSSCFNSISFLPLYPVFFIGNKKVFAVSYYKDVVKKLIRAVKYHNKKDFAFFQAKLMADYWHKLNISQKNFTVIPVPMFFQKEKKRKYNHMNLVGQKFCEFTGFNLDTKSIVRNRNTKPQYNLSKVQREQNLKGAFSVVNQNLCGPILLIDDISTTGTTLKEIINVLKQNGIEDIVCFVTAVPNSR